MRKIVSLLPVLLLLCTFAFGQTRTVTGIVKSTNGDPIPFATITENGTKNATTADANGSFTITIKNGSKLTISSVGHESFILTPGEGTQAVTLKSGGDLAEVVVTTALGISRSKRSLGYAAQELKGDQLSQTKQYDLNTALAGKISGIQVLGGSGAKFGTSTLRIRGINSISGSAAPIYVVDGVITDARNVNTDDVATVTVLKGPAATSLYGQRGEQGAVVITTKKGTRSRGVGIEINQSTTFEQITGLPEYQNEYIGGYTQNWSHFTYNPATDAPALAGMNGARYIDYSGDESWGPRIDGQPYAPWYSWNKWDPDYAKQVPLVAHPDNVKDFYDIGIAYNTNVSISKAGDGYSTRLSFTNINRTGITPNSKQKKNYIGYNISVNPFSKLTISSSVNASFTKLNAVPDEGYSQQTIGSFNQWFHRDIDMAKLKNYKNPDGTFTSWNIGGPRNPAPKYWDNPYTEVYENINRSNSSTLFGNINATYSITKQLKAGFNAQGNYATRHADGRVASGTLVLANYNTQQRRDRENTYIWDLSYDNKFGAFSLKAAGYTELRYIRSEEITEATVGGLTIPGFYNIAASKDRPNVTNTITEKQTKSIYGYTSVGFKNMLFVDVNLRNDWSSALPVDNNSYLYGGVSASFVFTELFKNKNILSFGRIRGSAGRVGSDVDAYSIHQVYTFNGFYGSTPSMTIPDRIPNEELKPAISHAYEAGAELRFLKDRIRADFNYYDRKVTDQIISLTLPATTGFSSALVNAGEIRNHGIEITLGGTIIKNKNITWDADFNLARNENQINELYPGITNFLFGSFGFSGSPRITANREVGQPFGTLIGLGFKRDASGNILVDDNGYPLTKDNVNFGSFLPDYTGGFTTMFNYKGFYAGFSMDFQIGGKYMSITNMFNAGSGLAAETAGLNENGKPKRDDISTGGGVLFHGIVESTGKPNTTYADAQTLYENNLFSLWENWVYDATYLKLREVSIGYNLPSKWVSKIGGQSGSFSIITQNPWLIYADSKKIDPSQLEDRATPNTPSTGTWYEGGQLPATKSLGFNLKIIF